MNAREIMTRDVATVGPDTPTAEIARILLDRGISAVPVVDAGDAPIGMVSEGDLIGRDETDRERRRDWWLCLLAEGEEISSDFLATLRRPERTARQVMSTPIVTANENTDAREIARLLANYRIKRVPIVRDGRIAGIVSRADLLRALANEQPQPAAPARRGVWAEVMAGLDNHFLHHRSGGNGGGGAPAEAAEAEPEVSASDFRHLVSDHEHHQTELVRQRHHAAEAATQHRVEDLTGTHMSDDAWHDLLRRARQAAENGEKEFLLLRFPSQLCADGGRAINTAAADWEATLRGEASEVFLRWRRDLKPHGFHLAARVLDFPGGKPGDIGLFLIWER